MQRVPAQPALIFEGDGDFDDRLQLTHTNRGEPYRQGVDLTFVGNHYKDHFGLFLDDTEAKRMRDWFNKLYPEKT